MSRPSPVPHALLEALRTFTHTITDPGDTQELLHRLTDHAVELTGSDGAGVMLTGPDGLGFAAAFDDEAIAIEKVQDRIQSGPCFDAFLHNRVEAVPDLEASGDWGAYRQRALELGFRSVLGVPLNAAGHTIGVLNIYRRRSGAWLQSDIDTAEVLASMAAAYVLNADVARSKAELAHNLRRALEGRDLIGQAKGVLVARHGISSNEAFEMLRTTSQETNTKLRDVAADILAREAAGERA